MSLFTNGKVFDLKEQTADQVEELIRKSYELDEDPDATAAEKNLDIRYANEDELLIDVDTEEAYESVKHRLGCIGNAIAPRMTEKHLAKEWNPMIREYPSKSGLPHRHLIITLPSWKMDKWERICLQFMLGSDFVREGLSVLEALIGQERPTYFFELKEGCTREPHLLDGLLDEPPTNSDTLDLPW
jgi:hypothetical protein